MHQGFQTQQRPHIDNTLQSNLLIIEDNICVQKVYSLYLRQTNYHIDYANCGHDALTLCQDNHYDIIILDFCLPDINGFAVCQQLRMMPHHHDTPVIVISSSRPSNINSMTPLMINRFVNKPVSKTDFINILQQSTQH